MADEVGSDYEELMEWSEYGRSVSVRMICW